MYSINENSLKPESDIKIGFEEITFSNEIIFNELDTNEKVGFWDVGFDGKIIYVNNYLAHLLGSTPEYLTTTSVYDYLFYNDLDRNKNLLKQFRMGLLTEIELRFRTIENLSIWCRIRGNIQNNSQGNPIGLSGILKEITNQKSAKGAMSSFRRQLPGIDGKHDGRFRDDRYE